MPYVIVPDGSGLTVDYPSVAVVLRLDADDRLLTNCTATLIGPSVVLTAAHCASNVAGVFFQHGGFFGLSTPPEMHPEYSGKLPDADLAVLFLGSPTFQVGSLRSSLPAIM